MVSDKKVFVGASGARVSSPLLANEEVFEIALIQLVFLHCLALEVLNFEIREGCRQVDDAACDGVEREVDFFVLESVLPQDRHRDGATRAVHGLVAAFFRRLAILLTDREVDAELDFVHICAHLGRGMVVLGGGCPRHTSLAGRSDVLVVSKGEVDLARGEHVLRNHFKEHVGARNDLDLFRSAPEHLVAVLVGDETLELVVER
mmetsp:Transcript_42023/g.55369  ORF Transcript_42023/g.55369 Transcript_42023/m.55369 type:complete len:204 (-) Transcript_42023:557-1168(-)